jgi:hypothetical protein
MELFTIKLSKGQVEALQPLFDQVRVDNIIGDEPGAIMLQVFEEEKTRFARGTYFPSEYAAEIKELIVKMARVEGVEDDIPF